MQVPKVLRGATLTDYMSSDLFTVSYVVFCMASLCISIRCLVIIIIMIILFAYFPDS